jgi:predicted RNase H-like HicB family nuclease
LKLKVILEPSEEGGYTIYAPSLPGCTSEGNSEAEALSNIKEAIELYLEPVDDELFVSDSHLTTCPEKRKTFARFYLEADLHADFGMEDTIIGTRINQG